MNWTGVSLKVTRGKPEWIITRRKVILFLGISTWALTMIFTNPISRGWIVTPIGLALIVMSIPVLFVLACQEEMANHHDKNS